MGVVVTRSSVEMRIRLKVTLQQLCSFTVNSGISINTTTGVGIDNRGTITTLNNSGSISTRGDGIENGGTITTLNNSGTISTPTEYGIYNFGSITTLNNSNTGTISGHYGILNSNTGTIMELNNSRTISGNVGIVNRGEITALNNSSTGTISSVDLDEISTNGAINNVGNILTLNNSGMISSANYGIQIFVGATIDILNNTNTGTISSYDAAIGNSGTITELNNAGTISASGDSPIYNSGIITTLNNTGTISGPLSSGIWNDGTITTLNNQQGKLGGNPLTYRSLLPINYNIIIVSAANYGQLAASLLAIGTTTTFGVSSLSTAGSTILNTPLTSVLSGITSEGLTNQSGTSNGYTFVLTETVYRVRNLELADYSMQCVLAAQTHRPADQAVSNISSGTSVGLASIGASPVLSGGTVVLLSGDSSSTAFSVTSASTIQNPTSGSATLSGVFSGAGGLTFIGTGSTIMSGANTYSGGTTVSGGTLVVAGPSPTGTGDVFVASAGTLMGTGTIAGNSIVSGVLKPGNSPGYLSFTKNLTLNSGSTYQQDIAGTVQASSSTPVGASGYYSFVNCR
jgi:autotransporter-associated beta strand protein